jgi:ABC-type multidrug transport system permease subunit
MNSLFKFTLFQLKEMYREPAILFWAYIFPIFLAGTLGLAFSGEKKTIAFAGWVSNQVPPTSEVIRWLPLKEDEITKKLQRGEISLYVSDSNGRLKIFYDPANSEAVQAATQFELEIMKKSSSTPVLEVEKISAPGSRYIDFLIPGLLALGIMNSCIWGIGFGLIEMRSKKLLVRYYITPFSNFYFFLSFYLVRMLNVLLEVIILSGFGLYFFDFTFRGSILGLGIVLFSGLFAFGGIAILVGSRTAKNEIGYGLINTVTFPMLICSGIFFSNKGFPDWISPVIQSFPLTIIADSLRSLYLEGAGIPEILFPSMILLVVGGFSMSVGAYLFRWTSE